MQASSEGSAIRAASRVIDGERAGTCMRASRECVCENARKLASGADLRERSLQSDVVLSPFHVVSERVKYLVLELVFDQCVEIIVGILPRSCVTRDRLRIERIRWCVLHVAG